MASLGSQPENVTLIQLKSYNSLVGGWTTPLKNMLVKMGIFPNFRGENQKCLSCHHPDLLLGFNTRQLLFSFDTGSEFLDDWSTELN